MASFVVLEPEGLPEGLNEEPTTETTVFVRDGFAFFALIVPFFWLLSKRLWLEALVVLAATIAIGSAANIAQFAPIAPFLAFLIAVLVALEGNNWQIAKWRRRGFIEKAVIDANDLDEAEIRYFVDHASLRRQAQNSSTRQNSGTIAETAAFDKPEKSPPHFPYIGSQIGLVSHRGDNS